MPPSEVMLKDACTAYSRMRSGCGDHEDGICSALNAAEAVRGDREQALVEALRPFAAVADELDKCVAPLDGDLETAWRDLHKDVTLLKSSALVQMDTKHFHTARHALAAHGTASEEKTG